MFLEVAKDKSESEYARKQLESCIQAAWDKLEKPLFDSLYMSIKACIEACIAAHGWHMKY